MVSCTVIESVRAGDPVLGDVVFVGIIVDGMSVTKCVVGASVTLLVCDVASSLLPSCKLFVMAKESVSLADDTVDGAFRSSVVLTSVECSVIGLFVTMGSVIGSVRWTIVVTP